MVEFEKRINGEHYPNSKNSSIEFQLVFKVHTSNKIH